MVPVLAGGGITTPADSLAEVCGDWRKSFVAYQVCHKIPGEQRGTGLVVALWLSNTPQRKQVPLGRRYLLCNCYPGFRGLGAMAKGRIAVPGSVSAINDAGG